MQVYTDGACRGNPGDMSIGVLFIDNQTIKLEISEYMGIGTNNISEYLAVIRALEVAIFQLGLKKIIVFSDSELLVNQLNGTYKVKNKTLLNLYLKVKALARQLESISFVHIKRNQNSRADYLANLALDRFK